MCFGYCFFRSLIGCFCLILSFFSFFLSCSIFCACLFSAQEARRPTSCCAIACARASVCCKICFACLNVKFLSCCHSCSFCACLCSASPIVCSLTCCLILSTFCACCCISSCFSNSLSCLNFFYFLRTVFGCLALASMFLCCYPYCLSFR